VQVCSTASIKGKGSYIWLFHRERKERRGGGTAAYRLLLLLLGRKLLLAPECGSPGRGGGGETSRWPDHPLILREEAAGRRCGFSRMLVEKKGKKKGGRRDVAGVSLQEEHIVDRREKGKEEVFDQISFFL